MAKTLPPRVPVPPTSDTALLRFTRVAVGGGAAAIVAAAALATGLSPAGAVTAAPKPAAKPVNGPAAVPAPAVKVTGPVAKPVTGNTGTRTSARRQPVVTQPAAGQAKPAPAPAAPVATSGGSGG